MTALVEPLRDQLSTAPADADVFHRPYQVGSLEELAGCLEHGRRFVLTPQDLIAYRSPAYFASEQSLAAFRRTTSAAFAAADHLGFISAHAACDAASEGFVEADRATVVPNGVDHVRADGPGEQPPQLSALGGRPFLLFLGTAFQHKNRLFALRVLGELVEEHGWEGGLVLAGRDVPHGSSLPDERRLLSRHPRLRERTVIVDHVSDSELRGLYRGAALVLFPSLYEGFGLVPFEAAAFGTPCLYAWRGPVPEFLPRSGALPSGFSAAAAASRVLDLVGDAAARDALVAEIQTRAADLTWDRTAQGYVEIYRRALERPRRPIDRALLQAGPIERVRAALRRVRPGSAGDRRR